MTTKPVFRDWLAEKMQDPGFQAEMQELEPAYQVARLRIAQGLTQTELAEKVGTSQSRIAGLESGKRQPSLRFLRQVADALGVDLRVELVERNPVPQVAEPPADYRIRTREEKQ